LYINRRERDQEEKVQKEKESKDKLGNSKMAARGRKQKASLL
jgi:hypothetical protein